MENPKFGCSQRFVERLMVSPALRAGLSMRGWADGAGPFGAMLLKHTCVHAHVHSQHTHACTYPRMPIGAGLGGGKQPGPAGSSLCRCGCHVL